MPQSKSQTIKRPISEILKHFALSEALFRGTALASNLILISIISTEKGFGAKGLLTSAFIQMTLSGLLELPTGHFADRFGWKRSVTLGLWIKVINTLLFIVAVIGASQGSVLWTWLPIVCESITDAFANAFLSGAFQASYMSWYKSELANSGINSDDAPPLFVSSQGYKLFLRTMIPIIGFVIGAAAFKFSSSSNPAVLHLALLGFILALRFVVIRRITGDLSHIKHTVASPKSESHNIKNILKVFNHRAGDLVLYGFGTLSMISAGFYLYGEIYRSIAKWIPNGFASWAGGSVIGLAIHFASTVLLWQISIRTSNKIGGLNLKLALAPICALAIPTLLGALGLLPHGAQVVSIALYCVAAITLGTLIQRSIASRISNLIPNSILATWFSAAEVIGLLTFGVLAFISLRMKIENAGVLVFPSFIGIAALVFMVFSGRNTQRSSR